MAWRARRSPGDWGVFSGERFGRYLDAARFESPIWVHAVSLGETRAAQPLIQALLNQGDRVLLTHMTATGRAEGARAFAPAIERGQLVQQWLPYDFPASARRFLAHYKPCVGILIEREVWPNIIAAAQSHHVPMMLVSARLSDRSLRQSLRAGSVMQKAYGSFEGVYAQTLDDAQRLEQAGASAVRVSGNLKFDISLPSGLVARGRRFAAALPRKMIVIASTRESEDELFVQTIGHQLRRAQAQSRNLAEHILFCLIPRHPRRFDITATLLKKAGLTFVRRSELADMGEAGAAALRDRGEALVLLGDSLGEMPIYYAGCHVAIIAGSFQNFGGQNLIEACAVGAPVLVGPHTWNFQQSAAEAIDEGAALRVQNAETALQTALQLLDEPAQLKQMGEAGVHWVQKHTGAVARILMGVNQLKDRTQPPAGDAG